MPPKRKPTKSSDRTLPSFLKKSITEEKVDDFINKHEETIINGERGVMIKYFHIDKSGRKKVVIFRNKDGVFVMKTNINGSESEKNLSADELIATVKSDGDLSFALQFLKSVKGGRWLSRRNSATKSKPAPKKRRPSSATKKQRKLTGKRRRSTGRKARK